MNIRQATKMALKSVTGNKGRSFLTMLGIIIGVAAVIVLVSLVSGMQEQMRQQFERYGTNLVNIYVYDSQGKDLSSDIETFYLSLPADDVVGYTPSYAMWGSTLRYRNKTLDNARALLGSEKYGACYDYTIKSGRDLSYLDVSRLSPVCVIGDGTRESLFNYEDPIGKKLSFNGVELEVVGVYELKSSGNPNLEYDWEKEQFDNILVIPYTLASRVLKREGPAITLNEFVIKGTSGTAVKDITDKTNEYMRRVLGEQGYQVYSDNQWIEQNQEALGMIGLVLGGIAAISLVVGGIGIMNIMLVTVTERTREIGIRKAIGAPRRSIIVQFLIEAGVISLFGGLIGLLLGTGLTLILGKVMMDMILFPTFSIVMLAIGVSIAFGIVFGCYPAVRASKLQPVEALRNE
ncbi:ABC transporter permease [Oscillospiraceae bacterium OttesenSCG-928-G22]|nr:ABC transporter permease [Oscillospiraceae bacterium OttesenSCG-928-G22]